MGCRGAFGQDVLEEAGGFVTEEGAGAAGEDGGQPPLLPAVRGRIEGEDAGVQAVKPAGLTPLRDRPATEAGVPELRQGDQPVLTSSDSGDFGISVDGLTPLGSQTVQ